MPLDPRQTYARDLKAADLEFSATERKERLEPLLGVMVASNGPAILVSGLQTFPTQRLPTAATAVMVLAHDQVGSRCGRELLRKNGAIAAALVDAICRTPSDDAEFWTFEAGGDRLAAVYIMLATLGFVLTDDAMRGE